MAFNLTLSYTFVAGTTIVAAETNANNTAIVNWCTINKFAGTSNPDSPSEGQWFYRTDLNELRVYNGSTWDSVLLSGASVTISTITTSSNGDLDLDPNGTGRSIVRHKACNTAVKTTTCTLTVGEAGQIELTAASAWVCTLPACSSSTAGLTYIFKKTGSGTYAITITAQGTNTIDGETSKSSVLVNQYDAYCVIGNNAGTGWCGY